MVDETAAAAATGEGGDMIKMSSRKSQYISVVKRKFYLNLFLAPFPPSAI